MGNMPTPLKDAYMTELAESKLIRARHKHRECTLELTKHKLNIELMPVQLGNFEIVTTSCPNIKSKFVCQVKIVSITFPSKEVLSA